MEQCHQHNEYDLDDADETFLHEIRREMAEWAKQSSPANSSKGASGVKKEKAGSEPPRPVTASAFALKNGAPFAPTDDMFEKIIDYFEKESFRLVTFLFFVFCSFFVSIDFVCFVFSLF
jgi:hypothetical protein